MKMIFGFVKKEHIIYIRIYMFYIRICGSLQHFKKKPKSMSISMKVMVSPSVALVFIILCHGSDILSWRIAPFPPYNVIHFMSPTSHEIYICRYI